MSTRRMVALYDYDPRESSPNIDVEVLPGCGCRFSRCGRFSFVVLTKVVKPDIL